MDDLRAALHDAVPPARPLDLTAVRGRSARLRRRRTLASGAAALAVVGALATGTALTLTDASTGDDELRTAQEPPVSAAPSPPAEDLVPVALAFGSNCQDYVIVERQVPRGDATPEGVLRALFAGPTEQEHASLYEPTVFGPATAGMLRSVRMTDQGAYVDLDGSYRDRILDPGRCEAKDSLDQVRATFDAQFPQWVAPVNFAFDGNPKDLVEFLGGTCPDPVVPGGFCDPEPFKAVQP